MAACCRAIQRWITLVNQPNQPNHGPYHVGGHINNTPDDIIPWAGRSSDHLPYTDARFNTALNMRTLCR